MTQDNCGVDGCPKPHRARGLCSTHYNRQYMPAERHRKVMTCCAWCSTEMLKYATQRYERRFCSLACRDAHRAEMARQRKLPVLFVGKVIRPEPESPLPAEPPRSTKRWVAGNCHRCGKAYVAEDYTNTARFCSTNCARRVSKHRYRARKKQAYVADVSPRAIYERDGWRCKLCGKKVQRNRVAPHPQAPVLDHVIPLAAGIDAGGVHEPANVQCAHFLCNSIKRDRVERAVQLALM